MSRWPRQAGSGRLCAFGAFTVSTRRNRGGRAVASGRRRRLRAVAVQSAGPRLPTDAATATGAGSQRWFQPDSPPADATTPRGAQPATAVGIWSAAPAPRGGKTSRISPTDWVRGWRRGGHHDARGQPPPPPPPPAGPKQDDSLAVARREVFKLLEWLAIRMCSHSNGITVIIFKAWIKLNSLVL